MRAACAEAQLADADWAELRATAAATSFDRHQLNARLKDLGITKLGQRLMILNQLRALDDEAAAGPLGGASIAEALGDNAAAFEARGEEATEARGEAAATGAPAERSVVKTPSPWPQRFEVVHSPFVYVREGRSEHAHRLGYRWKGEAVTCVGEEDGWLELAEGEGFMLRHGGRLGLGALLRPLGGASAAQPAPTLDAAERAMRQLVERQFPRRSSRARRPRSPSSPRGSPSTRRSRGGCADALPPRRAR